MKSLFEALVGLFKPEPPALAPGQARMQNLARQHGIDPRVFGDDEAFHAWLKESAPKQEPTR